MAYVNKLTGEVCDDTDDDTVIDEHKIYDDGYDAASLDENYDPELNPWPEGSYAAGVWEDGWYDYDMNER